MDAQASTPLIAQTFRRTLMILRRIALAVIALTALYALAGWIGSSIPRNQDWREPRDGITIMVETNGIHTSLVMPAVTPEIDWRKIFPPADLAEPAHPFTHVSVSWGEREVFLNTPTWWDLKPSTVLRIIGVGGEGILHVSWYVRPAPDRDIRPLRLSRTQYRALTRSILAQIPRTGMKRHPGYGPRDVFYESGGSYTAVRTCNQWTGDRLAESGVRIGRWTPFAGGVMKWVPDSPPYSAQTVRRGAKTSGR